MNNGCTFTYQTRFEIDDMMSKILDEYAEIFSKVERKLFTDISSGKNSYDLKSSYLKSYGITARQFNAARIQLEGKIASIKQRTPQLIADLHQRIESLEKKIEKLKPKNKFAIHQKKRRLFRLECKRQKLEEDQKNGVVRICFGGKKLFNEQFNLEQNGYQSHEEWKDAFNKTRNSEFFVLGSKDETGGNQSCTATICEDNKLSLRLRLPNALIEKYGKYLTLSDIQFNWGHLAILASLNSCLGRQMTKASNKKDLGQAISYRFKKDKKGWRIFASTTLQKPEQITKRDIGAIGLDINADHLALCETDRFGNPIETKIIPLNTYGKSKNQSLAEIGNATSEIFKWAEEIKKPIIIEKLDFQKKKTTLKEEGFKKHARMLSSFAYNQIIRTLNSRAWRSGVSVYTVNPAYTSIIGLTKFAHRYGLSKHTSAALCIVRRYYGFSEQPPKLFVTIPDGKDALLTLPLPVRNRGKHVWSFWRSFIKKIRVALAAHFRTIRNRSSDPPLADSCDSKFPEIVGETPTHESLAELLG